MAKGKRLSGNGWSFEPAERGTVEPEPVSRPPEQQKIRVTVEKRAKGKLVTVIRGFVLSDSDRKSLAARLKKLCGAGGSDDRESIELQGDFRDKVGAILAGQGWTVR